jgi:hypothetical protein
MQNNLDDVDHFNELTELDQPTESREPRAVPLAAVAKIKNIQATGVYIKTYFVPRGTKLYSKFFPTDHVTILAYGSILMEDGETQTRYVAPAHYIFPANRRIGIITLEDSVWYCVHATEETDLETLEKKY